MVKIAVLGHGVVGSGVIEVLQKNAQSIAKKAAQEIEVKYILDLRDFPDLPYSDLFVKDYDIILKDPEVSIVVEVLGGLHPAYDFSKAALEAGKSVVTSNKEVVAEKGAELLKIAKENNLNYLFEASVGGGIPIIRPLNQCLAANELHEIYGILNGTTNYILSEMIHKGKTFEDALADAQAKGYAERNPAADVEGIDACRKICILASLAFGRHVYPKNIQAEGITRVSLTDVRYASAAGGAIKLIGQARELEDGRVFAAVSPCIVMQENPMAGVEDVFNAILVRGDAIGDVMFYGRGAGKLPTASAVVADVIDEVKHLSARKYLYWVDAGDGFIADHAEVSSRFFLRAEGSFEIPAAFGKVVPVCAEGVEGETAFLTESINEGEFDRARAALEQAGVKVLAVYRVID